MVNLILNKNLFFFYYFRKHNKSFVSIKYVKNKKLCMSVENCGFTTPYNIKVYCVCKCLSSYVHFNVTWSSQ